MVTTLERQIAELARILGEPVEAIQADNPRWLQLLQEGVIVRLTLRRWRGMTDLDLERDLGLPRNGGPEYQKLLNLGRKFLLPKELVDALQSVDSGARRNLQKYGYETHWGIFVPAASYPAWKESNEKYRAKYFELRDQIVAFYADTVEAHLDQFEAVAREAWRRYHRLGEHIEEDSDFNLDEENFVSRYMARLRALVPPPEEIAASFAYEVHLHYIPLPSLLAQDVREAAFIQASREASEILERARDDADSIRSFAQREAEIFRRRAMEEIRRDVREAAQREKERLIDGFLVDVARQLRGLVYDTVVAAYETTARRGALHARTALQLRNLIEQVQRLNFFGDREVDTVIARIRELLGDHADDREPTEIRDALKNVAIVMKASLLALGDETRRERDALGMDFVPAAELRRAQRALGLDAAVAEELPRHRYIRSI